MRRYYVTTFDVMHAHKDIMAMARAVYIDLGNGMVLVSAKLASEAHEDIWHDHPEVTLLPDPVFNGTAVLSEYLAAPASTSAPMSRLLAADAPTEPSPENAFTALEAVGVTDTDTVLDLEAKVRLLNPGMRLRSIL